MPLCYMMLSPRFVQLGASPVVKPERYETNFVTDGRFALFQGHVEERNATRATCVNRLVNGTEEQVETAIQVDDAILANAAFFKTISFTVLCEFSGNVHEPLLYVERVKTKSRRIVPRPHRRLCVCSKLYGSRSAFHLRTNAVKSWMDMWRLYDAHVMVYLLGKQSPVRDLHLIDTVVNFTHERHYETNRNYREEVESEYQRANENCLLRSIGVCDWLLNVDVDETLVVFDSIDRFLQRHQTDPSIGFVTSTTNELWKRMFRPSVHSNVDAHGSKDEVVVVDREEGYIVHSGHVHHAESNTPPEFITRPMRGLSIPSTYVISNAQGYEAFALYSIMRTRYQTMLPSRLTAMFVFNRDEERVYCSNISDALRHVASRMNRDTHVIPSWSACPDALYLSDDQEDGDGDESISIPFVSHVRWTPGEDIPWSHAHRRHFRASFVGSTSKIDLDARRIRHNVSRVCRAWSECENVALPQHVIQNSLPAIQRGLKTKRDSVFCLEPQGENIGRRSVLDSLLLGCIPVFIDVDPSAWKRLYSNFVDMTELAVYVPPDMLDDLPILLEQFDVECIQRRIRSEAIRLTYSLSNFSVGDAGDIFAALMTHRRPFYKHTQMTR